MIKTLWERSAKRREQGKDRWFPPLLILLAYLLLLVSCSSQGGSGISVPGGQNQNAEPATASGDPTAATGDATVPEPAELYQALAAELARRGINPARSTSSAPAGEANRVLDLRARLVEPDAAGADQTASIELTWTEVLTGDYNQDGIVNATDLTPLGQYYNATVEYDDPAQHCGFSAWPSGDPSGDGALNWRLARIDGNRNGLVEQGDITTIAQHWGERLDGYRIYYNGSGSEEFTPVMNPTAPDQVFTLPRGAFAPGNGAGLPVVYNWDGVIPEPGQSRLYIVPWSSTDNEAGPASDTVEVYLNLEPVAKLDWAVADAAQPYTIEFSAAGSYDPDGSLSRFEWDLDGDGTFETATGVEPVLEHTFPGPGSNSVGLKVTDDAGATATVVVEIFLDHWISAAFNVSPPVVKTGDSVLFQPGDSWSSRGISLYAWDFQTDGVIDVVSSDYAMQEYIFTDPGEYQVTLTVTDAGGNQASATGTVTVIDRLHVELTPLVEKGLAPFETTFVVETYLAQGGVTYDWDFDGDGSFDLTGGTVSTVHHSYPQVQTYNALVRASDGEGNIAEDMVQVKACSEPTAVITSGAEYYWSDSEYNFGSWESSDADGEIVERWWDFDGAGDWVLAEYTNSPRQQFTVGDHQVSLRVVDDDGYSSEVVTFDFHVAVRSGFEFNAVETVSDDEITVDFQVTVTVDDSVGVERLFFHCGDGETIEFGQATSGSGSHTYAPGSYVYYACAIDGAGSYLTSGSYRIDPGGGRTIPDGLPVLVIRNDAGVYDANYDAIIHDLNELGLGFDAVDYYPGISQDYTCQDHSPVIWYRGGPGAWFEPQEYTRQWTTEEIDDYLQIPRSGNRLLLMSQSHGINNDAYGFPCTGWEGWFGWEILPGSIPDGDPRHCWAPGTTIASGCAASGAFGFLKMSPRNLKVTTELGGRYRRTDFGYYHDSAERYDGEGGSGCLPGDLDFGLCTQVCGMGFQAAIQADRFGEGFTPGVATDPMFENSWDMAFLSWGCRGAAPYENTGLWPPPYDFKPGTGSLWIVGYPWATTSVKDTQLGDEMTRADLLRNILGWLEKDPD